MNITTTASAIQPGDFLHRVQPVPHSAVFDTPVDAKVLSVEPIESAPGGYVHITLEPKDGATALALNLQVDHQVTIVRDDEPQGPVDPDTIYLTRAARNVTSLVDAWDHVQNEGAKADVRDRVWASRQAVLTMWEDLTGLVDQEAIEYAYRLTEQAQEVSAHVRPF
jgi:hypothetical protein